MSAVLKETYDNLIDGGLAVIEQKSLSVILAVPEKAPKDLFKNADHLNLVKAARAATTNLTYSIDDEGEKLAKSDVAAMRKYAKGVRGVVGSFFKALTDKYKSKYDEFTIEAKGIEDNANKILPQFEARKNAKLDEIREMLTKELNDLWVANEIKPEFRTGTIEPLVKLTGSLTPGGSIAKKAKDHIVGIITDNLAQQRKIEMRKLLIENRCLQEGIKQSLSPAHFGSVFYAADEFFNEKLEELIVIEVKRTSEMKAAIEKQNKADNQKKIDDALKLQQVDANRVALENAEKARQQEPVAAEAQNQTEVKNTLVQEQTSATLRVRAESIEKSAQFADSGSARADDMAKAATLRRQADELDKTANATGQKPVATRRTVRITATFDFENISDRVSNRGVEDFFRAQLPEKLRTIIVSVDGQNV